MSRKGSRMRRAFFLGDYVSRTKMTSILTRYSVIFEFSTATLISITRSPVIPLNVLVALAKPVLTASSKPLEEPAMISVTLATLGSAIPITSSF
jgi:hypothetical protein